jgi:sarcosine oxidase subunit beta
LRVLRHWGGIMDMSMDGSPIIDRTPIEGLFLNAGWCYGGFKATPGLRLVLRTSHRAASRTLQRRLSPRPLSPPAISSTRRAGAQPNLH